MPDDKHYGLAARVAEIMKSDLRLVAGDNDCEECGEPTTWKVKPGCIEAISEKISELVFSAMAAGDISVSTESATRA